MSGADRPGTLILTRSEVARLLSVDECIEAVEHAFKLQSGASTTIAGLGAVNGGFHIKAAMLDLDRPYFVSKVNANFPGNPVQHGLPTIQGILTLSDAGNGYPLAVMDSAEITALRTGAASAVAAKYLSRDDSRVFTICGCGIQGRIQLRSVARVRKPEIVYAFDLDMNRAEQLAVEMSGELGVEVEAVADLEGAVRASDLCITCTPSKRPIVNRDWVRPGAFIAAVGADSEHKQEIDPRLMASSKVVVDVLDQCATIGDLHHAIEEGLMKREDVHADLSAILSGRIAARENADEIIVFDSTGSALQDLAAAVVVYDKAVRTGTGIFVNTCS